MKNLIKYTETKNGIYFYRVNKPYKTIAIYINNVIGFETEVTIKELKEIIDILKWAE